MFSSPTLSYPSSSLVHSLFLLFIQVCTLRDSGNQADYQQCVASVSCSSMSRVDDHAKSETWNSEGERAKCCGEHTVWRASIRGRGRCNWRHKLCNGAQQQQQRTAERAALWFPLYMDMLLPQLSNWLPGRAAAPQGFTSLFVCNSTRRRLQRWLFSRGSFG